MLTTAEEFEEQWLTMTDCTDEGWEACESVSEYDRFGAPPASCWRMERSGGRLKLGGLEFLDAWRLSGLRTANCASHSHLTVVNSCSRTAWSFQPQEGQTNVARTRRRMSPLGSFGLRTSRYASSHIRGCFDERAQRGPGVDGRSAAPEVFASSFGTFSADAAPNTTPSSASGRRAKHNSLVR